MYFFLSLFLCFKAALTFREKKEKLFFLFLFLRDESMSGMCLGRDSRERWQKHKGDFAALNELDCFAGNHLLSLFKKAK